MSEPRAVELVQEGDTFHDGPTPVWVAMSDARVVGDIVQVDVRFFADGGNATREWDTGSLIVVD